MGAGTSYPCRGHMCDGPCGRMYVGGFYNGVWRKSAYDPMYCEPCESHSAIFKKLKRKRDDAASAAAQRRQVADLQSQVADLQKGAKTAAAAAPWAGCPFWTGA